jgi:hypothetical protein
VGADISDSSIVVIAKPVGAASIRDFVTFVNRGTSNNASFNDALRWTVHSLRWYAFQASGLLPWIRQQSGTAVVGASVAVARRMGTRRIGGAHFHVHAARRIT